MTVQSCINCSSEMPPSHSHRKYCSPKCKAAYRKVNPMGKAADGHNCRVCGVHFPIGPGQYNKWLCSDACRRVSNAKSVREFHLRQPLMESIYRAKTREKKLPDSNQIRFYRANPMAPHFCESCNEDRVLEIAHRPGFERFGKGRSVENCKWPEMVWVLCPTCHRLLDRMNYSAEELGLR